LIDEELTGEKKKVFQNLLDIFFFSPVFIFLPHQNLTNSSPNITKTLPKKLVTGEKKKVSHSFFFFFSPVKL
jgi:hypothetical protein